MVYCSLDLRSMRPQVSGARVPHMLLAGTAISFEYSFPSFLGGVSLLSVWGIYDVFPARARENQTITHAMQAHSSVYG